MAAKRKLFLTHAGELANLLAHAVGTRGLVAQFVRGYAAKHNRPKLAVDPDRVRELERTIGREALLVVTVKMRELFPAVFATGKGGTLRPDERVLCAAFTDEFVKALRRAFDWQPSEIGTESEAFDRDLEMYERWSRPSISTTSTMPQGSPTGPFPDRCAILLDPAMMEQARRAAAKFEDELVVAAGLILARLGRSSVRNRPAKRDHSVQRIRHLKGSIPKRRKASRSSPKAKGRVSKSDSRKRASRSRPGRRSPS